MLISSLIEKQNTVTQNNARVRNLTLAYPGRFSNHTCSHRETGSVSILLFYMSDWYQRSCSRVACAWGEEKSNEQSHLQGASFPCLEANKQVVIIIY